MTAGASASGPEPTGRDISVVVQGPVVGGRDDADAARLTLRCLASVARHLPGAERILSTWRGTDVSGLSFDRLVESDDPGGTRCDAWPNTRSPRPLPYNANRQIVSSRAGLRVAARPYAVKIRSDMELTGTGFLRYFGRYEVRAGGWRLLRERVVIPNWWSQNPRGRSRKPFHPSDWFQFGRTDDLRSLWDVPLTGAELPMWFATRPFPPGFTDTVAFYRYTVEQYLWLSFLRLHGDVSCEHANDVRPETVALSELTLVNNFIVADLSDLGLAFLKYRSAPSHWGSLYTHGDWQRLYRAYCDPAYVCPPDPDRWAKLFYNRLVEPWHRVLNEPRSLGAVRHLSAEWERRAPRSFRAAKGAYVSGLSAVRGTMGQRA